MQTQCFPVLMVILTTQASAVVTDCQEVVMAYAKECGVSVQ